jgi:MscS family membrane protein
MQSLLNIVFLDNTISLWLKAAIFIAGGFAAAALCLLIFSLTARKYRKTKQSDHKSFIFYRLKTPAFLFLIIAGCNFAFDTLSFNTTAELWEDRILAILFIILTSWAAFRILDALIMHYIPVSGENHGIKGFAGVELQSVLRKSINVILILIPAILILKTLGYDINALLAGLGIGGAAIALASQKTLSNFFGSISVFIDKPFRLNERIKVSGYDGTITDIRLRTSSLKTLDNRIVTIPNSVFSSDPIENVTSEPHTKIVQTITIRAENGYQKTQKAISILKNIKPEEGALGAPSVAAVSRIGISFFQINFIYYIAKGEDYWGTINAVNMEVLRRFEEEGIRL